jgi:tetratricopeptide (TPR) repeat protein
MHVSLSATDKYNCQMLEAYVHEDMDLWADMIVKLKARYKKTKDKEDLFDVTFAQYGYLGYLIDADRFDEAKIILKEAEDNIDILIEHKTCPARAESIKAALNAYEIAMNPGKTFYLGPKTLNLINKAIEMDSTCPYGWVEKGNAYYHMPKIFGGDYNASIIYYKKAISLFEKNPKSIECNWYYMNTLMWLAKSYEKLERYKERNKVFKKMLKIAPDFDRLRKWMNRGMNSQGKDDAYG